VRHAGRRDQHAVVMPKADIARGPLVDAELVHAAAGVDDGLSFVAFVDGHGHWQFISMRYLFRVKRDGVVSAWRAYCRGDVVRLGRRLALLQTKPHLLIAARAGI